MELVLWNKYSTFLTDSAIATSGYKFTGVPLNVVGQSIVLRDSLSFGQLKFKISIQVDGGGA